MVDNAQLHQAYVAALSGDDEKRLALVREATSLEALSAAAPLAHERHAPSELVHAVLDSALCTPSLASRYGAHDDVQVRMRLAIPEMVPVALTMLSYDADERVRERALRALVQKGSGRPA